MFSFELVLVQFLVYIYIYIYIYMLIKTEYTAIFYLNTFRQQPFSISHLYMSIYGSLNNIYLFKKTKIHESWLQPRNCYGQHTFQTWIMNTSNLKCVILYSINSFTILDWRHYCINSLNAVMQTISQRYLKKSELMYYINYFFLKNLTVNLFICLHLETNSSRALNSDSESTFMIASYSSRNVYGWALQAIDRLIS